METLRADRSKMRMQPCALLRTNCRTRNFVRNAMQVRYIEALAAYNSGDEHRKTSDCDDRKRPDQLTRHFVDRHTDQDSRHDAADKTDGIRFWPQNGENER